MNRPMYETKKDLDHEKEVAKKLGKAWGVEFKKLPIRYHVDFVLTKGENAVGFCEVKTRNYTMSRINEMGGYIMSMGKWSAAKSLSETSGLPFILVILALDGMWYLKSTEFKHDGIKVRGRTDRDDWQDMEPCVILNCRRFKKVP